MKRLLALALCLILAGCAHRSIPPAHSLDVNLSPLFDGVQRTILPNGLTLITKEVHRAPVASVWMYYRVGVRDEPPGSFEISHVTEHMLFSSTGQMQSSDMDRLISLVGGYMNGSTGLDYTVFHEAVPSSYLNVALWIESERMGRAKIDAADLDREKGALYSELAGLQNNPGLQAEALARQAAFSRHPYGNPRGRSADVRALTVEAVRNWYRSHFAPDRAVLVVVGDFASSQLRTSVSRLFGGYRALGTDHRCYPEEPPQTAERRRTVYAPSARGYIELAYHAPPTGSRDHRVVDILRSLLDDDGGGRFASTLYRERITRPVVVGFKEMADPYLLTIRAPLPRGTDPRQAENAIERQLQILAEHPCTRQQLDGAVREYERGLIKDTETTYDEARILGNYAAIGCSDYLRQITQELSQVTPEDLQRVASQYLQSSNRTVVWLLPDSVGAGTEPSVQDKPGVGGKDAGIAPPSVSTPEDWMRIEAMLVRICGRPKPQRIRHRPLTRKILSNGITVLVYQDPTDLQASLLFGFRGGASLAPASQAGLAVIANGIIGAQTISRPQGRILQEMRTLGCTDTIETLRDRSVYKTHCFPVDLPRTLALYADMLRNSILSTANFRLAFQARLDSSISARADPRSLAEQNALAALYPEGSPLHWPDMGSPDTLASIGPEDVRGFWRRLYRPDRLILVVVGPVESKAVVAAVEQQFGSWKPSAVTSPENAPLSRSAGTLRWLRTAMPGVTSAGRRCGPGAGGKRSRLSARVRSQLDLRRRREQSTDRRSARTTRPCLRCVQLFARRYAPGTLGTGDSDGPGAGGTSSPRRCHGRRGDAGRPDP